MRETEFWRRLSALSMVTHPRLWAETTVLSSLGGRTPTEALESGVPCQRVWQNVCDYLEIPFAQR